MVGEGEKGGREGAGADGVRPSSHSGVADAASDSTHPAARAAARAPGERGPDADPLRRIGFALIAGAFVAALAWLWFEERTLDAYHAAREGAPTRIYAREMVLRPGERVDGEALAAYLEAAGYAAAAAEGSEGGPRVGRGEFASGEREWRVGLRPFRIGEAFHRGGLLRVTLDEEGRLEALERDGARLDSVRLEPPQLAAVLEADVRDRIPVEVERLPGHLVSAVLAIEDRRFRGHAGLDPRRILAALWANLRAGEVEEGGSTITQQLARSLFLTRERTLLRKAKEAALSLALDRRLEKEEILESYLDHVYLGQEAGVALHGVGRAARAYFDRDVTELDPAESALLAGLIQAPNLHSPFEDTAAARRRRALVLRAMGETGRLDPGARERAAAAPLPARRERPPRLAPYFADHVVGTLRERHPAVDLGRAGWTVWTSLSPREQRAAEAALEGGLVRLERRHPAQVARSEEPLQGALVSLDPRTGDILAMAGGRDHTRSPFNRAVDARRQPGSAFKPVVAAAALTGAGGGRDSGEAPEPYTLATPLEDEPFSLQTPQGPWRPVNADGSFRGELTLRRALELSRNVPFARLGQRLGPRRIVETARALGFRSELHPVPSLALGSSEVSLLEITSAYSVFAAEGVRHEPRVVVRIVGPDGRRWAEGALLPTGGDGDRVMSPAEAYVVTSALENVVRSGTAATVRGHGYWGPVAAKTGTTNDYRDGWTVGYTPERAVGVWVGFDSGRSLHLYSSTTAAPVFADHLRRVLGPRGGEDFRRPDGVSLVRVSPWSGLRADAGYCEGQLYAFLEGTAPTRHCQPDWPIIGLEEPDPPPAAAGTGVQGAATP